MDKIKGLFEKLKEMLETKALQYIRDRNTECNFFKINKKCDFFYISKEEKNRIPKTKCKSKAYHSWNYTFSPTGIGVIIVVKCGNCNLTKDITNYDMW